MSAGPEPQVIEKSALFERLARGRSAGVTVVTPNQRLSRALMLEFDAFQIGKALSVWEAPDILPFGAFVQRLYEDGLYADLSAELPMLLTPAQEEEVWKQVVGGSGLLAVEGAAAKCRDAWNLANLWRIRPGAGNQDTEAFAQWLTHYKKKTENDLDTPRLPDALQRFVPELKRPKLVVAYAFDILPPQTKEFLDALGTEIAFCGPDPRSATVSRAAFDSAKREIEAAARWARARLEAGGKRIGVVVPSLQEDRKEVARVFSRVMRPGGEKAAMPFNISIGIPLERYPVVALALSVLRISQEEIPFEEVTRIVRSPFIGGAEADRRRRPDAAAARAAGEALCAARDWPLFAEDACRVGAAFLQRARGRRLPGRARSRLGRVPDSGQVARSARRAVSPRSNLEGDVLLSGVSDAAKDLRRYALPAGNAGYADPGTGSARVRRRRVRPSLGHRPDRRSLAAEDFAQSLPAARAAAQGRHSRGERRDLARTRPAHHRRLEAGRRRSGVLAFHQGGGPRRPAEPAHRRPPREGSRDSCLPEAARRDLRFQENRDSSRSRSARRQGETGPRRHARSLRPGRVPVPRLRAPSPARRGDRGARRGPRRLEARQARAPLDAERLGRAEGLHRAAGRPLAGDRARRRRGGEGDGGRRPLRRARAQAPRAPWARVVREGREAAAAVLGRLHRGEAADRLQRGDVRRAHRPHRPAREPPPPPRPPQNRPRQTQPPARGTGQRPPSHASPPPRYRGRA